MKDALAPWAFRALAGHVSLGLVVLSASTGYAAAPAASDEAVQKDVSEIFADSRYVFCHEKQELSGTARSACEYATAGGTCPAFASSCQDAAGSPRSASSPLSVPEWLASFARVLFWTLIAAVVAWIARQIFLAARLGGASASESAVDAEKHRYAAEAEPAATREPVETDAMRLFAAARSAAAGGDVTGAVRLAHAALVRALEHEGHVRVDRSTTSGDYLRALRTQPELRDVFGGVARELERIEFGAGAPSGETIGHLLARVEPVVRRAGLALAVIVSLAAGACTPSGTRGDLNDDTPIGASALRQLLERRGIDVARRTEDLTELEEGDADTLLLLDSVAPTDQEWVELDRFTHAGGTLVLSGVPYAIPSQWGIHGEDPGNCDSPPRAVDGGHAPARAPLVGRAPVLHLDPAFQPKVVCDRGALVASSPRGSGTVVAISDRDFLSNASLASPGNARMVVSLFEASRRVDVVDRFLRAEGAADPYRAVAHSGLAPALLHALAWLVLLSVALGKSFGTPRDPIEPPRRAFADHVKAVGRLYELGGASRRALGVYAAWALEQLSTRLRPGGAQRVLDLSSAVAQRTRRPEGEIAAVLANAADARDHPDGQSTPAEDLAVLGTLDELLREAGGRR